MFSSDRIVSAELRGGYGLFAGRVPNVWIASPFAKKREPPFANPVLIPGPAGRF